MRQRQGNSQQPAEMHVQMHEHATCADHRLTQSSGEPDAFAEGTIRIRLLPRELAEDEQLYRYWWLPELDANHQVLRPARITDATKDRMDLAVFHNMIMTAGRTQVLTFIGSSSGTTQAFTQQFAVGTGAISGVSPNDTSLANEIFRKVPTSYSVQGTEVDINIAFGTTDAEATLTNCGIFGVNATGTLGSGSLMTHALFSFTKGAFAIAVDYIINLF
jgi:hypothetical protein